MRAGAVAAAAAAVVLAGCAAPGGEAELKEPLRSRVTSLVFEAPEIGAAQTKAIDACAKRNGWPHHVEFSTGGIQTMAGVSNVFPSVESAVRTGYSTTVREGGEDPDAGEVGPSAKSGAIRAI
ncbi:hypothetical protein [Arthrobacter sp. UM1]|uniref:hypothetical protein n=1 Tax=Arthrobacter sp. UM1 TaxID=2766776 RepID=UPI001CF6F9F3|nr:hypothetical protein [Arthrobacter sp. UM1]MCB4208879.1 hypothetical protein [Arthrobacter sp. UM1]